jgi:hypothetical protein
MESSAWPGPRCGEAVEDGAAGGFRLGQPLLDQGDDDLVGDQVAAVQHALDLLAELGARGDGGAQHVAGRQLDHAPLLDQALGLGALARRRRPEQDQVHQCASCVSAGLPPASAQT